MPSQRRSWNWQAPEQSAHLEQQPDRSSNWTCAASTAGARALPHWIRRCGRHAEAGRDGDAPDGGARHSGEGAAEKSQPARCAHLHWKCPSYPDIYRKIQVLIWCAVARTLQIWRQKGFECTHAHTHADTHGPGDARRRRSSGRARYVRAASAASLGSRPLTAVVRFEAVLGRDTTRRYRSA